MKACRHVVVGLTGRIDLDGVTRRMAERHSEMSIEDSLIMRTIPCKVFRSVSHGSLNIQESQLDFHMDLRVFRQGIFLFEITMEGEDIPKKVMEREFLTEQVGIRTEKSYSENPLYMHVWMFLFNLLDFEEVISTLGEVGSFSEESQIATHDAIYETSLVDSFYLGEQTYLQTARGFSDSALISGAFSRTAQPENAKPVYSEGVQVIKVGNVFFASREDEEFIDLLRFIIYRRNVMGIFNRIMSDWLESVSEQAKLIRSNLKETNKIYWKRLKRRLEVWDLNFLDIYASANRTINTLEGIETRKLIAPFSNEIADEYRKSRELLLGNMESLKYSISNLRTPCEAHDEDLLQKETEKVNERIMLLSFLAMSVPLLGAILAPGISTTTKLVAACFLVTLPAAYFYFRRIQKRKGNSRATVSYLRSQKKKLEAEIENSRSTLEEISGQEELDEATKSRSLGFVRKSLESSEKYLEVLESEIRKYS